MNYLPQLTENEVRYICSAIPLQDTIYYFQRNPKEFSKIMPGFRVRSLTQTQVNGLLFNRRKHHFISSFIEKHIGSWLAQIQEHIGKMIQDGNSKEVAHLHTFPTCFFVHNVGLFFKLANEEYSQEYIALLSAAVTATNEVAVQQDELQKERRVRESEIRILQAKLDYAKSNAEMTATKLNDRNMEIRQLRDELAHLEKLKCTMQNYKDIIVTLESKTLVREETINVLRNELAEAMRNQQREVQNMSETGKQHRVKQFEQQIALKPKSPRDIEEFRDYLGYNLENIGVPPDSEYYALLKEHLSKLLFQGLPIMINRGVAATLMKCIANALTGSSTVTTLSYSKDLSVDDVNRFLSSAGRLVSLDNFIGNCNETELLGLFDNHRHKVIFLTVAYDRTMHYVSREFLRYCQYLNLNRIAPLSVNAKLTEDPSTFEEIESESQEVSQDNRHASLLREMLGEFGIIKSLVEQKCATISDEQDLCRVLAFDVLPYCVDVLQIAPYNVSERLIKYAGDAGRCSYKNLLQGWFAR